MDRLKKLSELNDSGMTARIGAIRKSSTTPTKTPGHSGQLFAIGEVGRTAMHLTQFHSIYADQLVVDVIEDQGCNEQDDAKSRCFPQLFPC